MVSSEITLEFPTATAQQLELISHLGIPQSLLAGDELLMAERPLAVTMSNMKWELVSFAGYALTVLIGHDDGETSEGLLVPSPSGISGWIRTEHFTLFYQDGKVTQLAATDFPERSIWERMPVLPI